MQNIIKNYIKHIYIARYIFFLQYESC